MLDCVTRPKSPFIILTLLILLLSAGCDANNKKLVTFTPEEETIAVVNNKKISLATFNTRLQSFLERYRKFIISDDKRLAEIKEIVIQLLIDEELINQEAARKSIQVSDKEIQTVMTESVEPFQNLNQKELLKDKNFNLEEWKNQARFYLIERKLLEKEVLGKTPITKREITSYYQEHRQDFTVPQGFRVRNITLSTEEEARAILSQIKRGRSFRRLVREHSISPDKNVDGDLGYIERGVLPLEMETAIFRLGFSAHKSRLSDVIRSQDGYHIFKLIKYRRKSRMSLNQARPKIKQLLLDQRSHQSYIKWLNRLKDTATITIDQVMLAREEGF